MLIIIDAADDATAGAMLPIITPCHAVVVAMAPRRRHDAARRRCHVTPLIIELRC